MKLVGMFMKLEDEEAIYYELSKMKRQYIMNYEMNK
jgi:hypothetical protein